MATAAKSLYETDFVEWADRNARLLRDGQFGKLDLENVAEEIESLGNGARTAVRSLLRRILKHLITMRMQPDRASQRRWISIVHASQQVSDHIGDSPSLRPYAEKNLEKIYGQALNLARQEAKVGNRRAKQPKKCPYTLDQLLERDYDSFFGQEFRKLVER